MKRRSCWFAFIVMLIAVIAWLALKIFCSEKASSSQTPERPVLPQSLTQKRSAPQIGEPEVMNSSLPKPVSGALPIFKAGGIELPILFADGATRAELKAAIVKDINLVYGHLTAHESLTPIYKKSLHIQGRDITPIAQLNLLGVGRYYPAEHQDLMGVIVDFDGQKLVIPNELVAIYAKAQEREQRYPRAFSKMDDFVRRLNRLNDEPPEHASDILFLHPSAKEFAPVLHEMSREQLIETFGNRAYRQPSIIEVKEAGELLPELKGSLIAPLYRKVPGGITDTATPLIFHEGHWKLLIGG